MKSVTGDVLPVGNPMNEVKVDVKLHEDYTTEHGEHKYTFTGDTRIQDCCNMLATDINVDVKRLTIKCGFHSIGTFPCVGYLIGMDEQPLTFHIRPVKEAKN